MTINFVSYFLHSEIVDTIVDIVFDKFVDTASTKCIIHLTQFLNHQQHFLNTCHSNKFMC